jgi:hypothetical protein
VPDHRTYSLKLDSPDDAGWVATLWGRTARGGYARVAQGVGFDATDALEQAATALREREVAEGALP